MKRSAIKLLTFILPTIVFASGTVVRNGGDPLTHFLEATRIAMTETLREIHLDSNTNKEFCQNPHLSSDQIQFCREFFLEVSRQILTMNQGQNKTDFLLREDPLLVEGPDGKPMPVAARTELGPQGGVEFHRDSIKLMSPAQILFLITHEFQHKALYHNRSVTDNESIGPFASGRELLDTVAAAVVETAKNKGKVGSQYGIIDHFECLSGVSDVKVGGMYDSNRLFLTRDLAKYETSLGFRWNSIYIPEDNKSLLSFRMKVQEPGNCQEDQASVSQRETLLQIVRIYRPDEKGNRKPDETVQEVKMSGYNPLCEKFGGTVSLSHGNVSFSCHYYGSDGTTSSSVGLFGRK